MVVNVSAVPRDPPGRPRLGVWRILAAVIEAGVSWHADEVLRADVASNVPGVLDPDAEWPGRRYLRLGQVQEYARLMDDVRGTRRGYLDGFVGLDPAIVAAVT
jgi:hypothetical protein